MEIIYLQTIDYLQSEPFETSVIKQKNNQGVLRSIDTKLRTAQFHFILSGVKPLIMDIFLFYLFFCCKQLH